MSGGLPRALRGATHVIVDGDTTLGPASVVVEGPRIVAVGSVEEIDRRYSGAEAIDCTGLVLVPGLVNAHTHANETIMRGRGHDLPFREWIARLVSPVTTAMEAEGDELYAALGRLLAMEALASGTTAVVEHSVNFAKRHALTLARALRESGLRAAVARGADDYAPFPRDNVGTTERELAESREFLEAWAREPASRVQAWLGPSGGPGRTTGGCSATLLRELKAMARAAGTRVHTHLAGTRPEVEAIRHETGLAGSVAYARAYDFLDEGTSLAHVLWTEPEERDVLAATGAAVVHCPSCAQICALGRLPLRDLLDRGVTCALGTDGAPQNDSLDMFREMRQAVLLARTGAEQPGVVSHREVFRMATEGGAGVLGVPALGRLAPGWLADIVAVRVADNPFLTPLGDPLETLVYAASGGRDVAMTMVDGEIVYHAGRFVTLDASSVLATVRASTERLRASAATSPVTSG